MAVVAERAFTSRSTLQKVEAGDTNVSIGIYAVVLQALGLLDSLGEIADISRDNVGQPPRSCRSASASSAHREGRPTIADIEVHIDRNGRTRSVGIARSNKARGNETVVFE